MGHPDRDLCLQVKKGHIRSNEEVGTFAGVPRRAARGHRVLGSIWWVYGRGKDERDGATRPEARLAVLSY
ncbi:hypothetical protein SEPCBS119000_003456 [Sporothrix epigloea]|uniref:Uncharacterized protein n=1 Tax=Sporothrix epigloea TaxID=1892477 RepID=A0ABP0DQC5_9PEZI